MVVKELAGGCLCCALSGPLGASVAQLVRKAKPDRLLIEPSGLGHPAGDLHGTPGKDINPRPLGHPAGDLARLKDSGRQTLKPSKPSTQGF